MRVGGGRAGSRWAVGSAVIITASYKIKRPAPRVRPEVGPTAEGQRQPVAQAVAVVATGRVGGHEAHELRVGRVGGEKVWGGSAPEGKGRLGAHAGEGSENVKGDAALSARRSCLRPR